MANIWNIEKTKSFSADYSQIIDACKTVLKSKGFVIREEDLTAGDLIASVPVMWPFKPKKMVSLHIQVNGSVKGILKLRLSKQLSEAAIGKDYFFLNELFTSIKEELNKNDSNIK